MLDTLKVASAIELGRGAGMYESYVRGEVYLMLHDGKAGEFQKFMELSGRLQNQELTTILPIVDLV
jgi:hypothetical protein